MMDHIYLEIADRESLFDLISIAKYKAGIFRDIPASQLMTQLEKAEFPVRIPVKLNSVIQMAQNPLVRKIFGPKIEKTVKTCLAGAAERS